MAFDASISPLNTFAQTGGGEGIRFFSYRTDDPLSLVTAADYFAKCEQYGVRLGDFIFVTPLTSASSEGYILVINVIDANGNCSGEISSGGTYPPSGGDDTAAIQARLDDGQVVELIANSTYTITQSLIITHNGSGIIGPRTAKIFMPASAFNNTLTDMVSRYGPHTIGIYAHGNLSGDVGALPVEDVIIKGFTIESEVQDARVLKGVVARYARNTVIEGLEIYGFPAGNGIQGDSLLGDSHIVRNYIHDFYSNATWGTGPYQLTAIVFDADLISVDGVELDSEAVTISENHIEDIAVGPVFEAAYQYQTDGINLAGSNQSARYQRCTHNFIRNCGEGIDCFQSRTIIAHNTIIDSVFFGIKLIHGASDNVVSDNTVRRSGQFGILISGSSVARVQNNIITGNHIAEINPSGVPAGTETACITVHIYGTTLHPDKNFIHGNYCDPTPNGLYALRRTGGTNNDLIYNNTIAGTDGTLIDQLGATGAYISSTNLGSNWTPTLTTTGTQPTSAVVSASGFYLKQGPFIQFHGRLTVSDKGTGGTGNVRVGGFPKTASRLTVVPIRHAGPLTFAAGGTLLGLIDIDATVMLLESNYQGVSPTPIPWSTGLANGVDFIFSGTYLTNE